MALEAIASRESADTRYEVELPAFQGPVDLLLDLIESRRLEITAISLATVAGQYLEHIRSLGERDPADLAAFIEVAARLLLIKSRVLLPSAVTEEEEEDPAADLIQRLQEYRRYREASRWLSERMAAGLTRYSREPTLPDPPVLVPRPSRPAQLLLAMRRLFAPGRDEIEDDGTFVEALTFSLPEKVKLILRRLIREAAVLFSDLIAGARSRPEVVVTFVAVLELVRRHRVVATQEDLFGPISISRNGASPNGPSQEALEPAEEMC